MYLLGSLISFSNPVRLLLFTLVNRLEIEKDVEVDRNKEGDKKYKYYRWCRNLRVEKKDIRTFLESGEVNSRGKGILRFFLGIIFFLHHINEFKSILRISL